MKKLFFLLSTLLSFTIFSCKKADPILQNDIIWKKYTYKEYNGYLLLSHKDKKLYGILCADVVGIKGRLKLEHDCTEAQYKTLLNNIKTLGTEYQGEIKNPDFTEYPDLSMYLSFVISSDELHQIWSTLGLE